MGKSLTEIAQQLKDSDKRVQLIYAFNGVGKTRLSCEFKELVSPKDEDNAEIEEPPYKILYYNAFTEDLFYWDNDLDNDQDRKIKIQPNSFTDWLLKDEGQENVISDHFLHYTNSKLSPNFDEKFSEITFSAQSNDGTNLNNIKISKGEESNFVWCVFYAMLELVVTELKSEKDTRSTKKFDDLKYIFIDDPVTSLDENHLIKLAVDLARLVKESPDGLKFIITTHNPLFFNVLHNEIKGNNKYILCKYADNTYSLKEQKNDSPFSYHNYLLAELEEAIESDSVHKYHFNFLRNIFEKTSTFLGYTNWGDLLPEDKKHYYTRLVNISSHSKFSSMEVPPMPDEDKQMLKELAKLLFEKYHFKRIPELNTRNEAEQ